MTKRDVAVGAIGAVLGASALGAVFAGIPKVMRRSPTDRRVDKVACNETAQGEGAFAEANRNLAETVRSLRLRLEKLEGDKASLQQQLEGQRKGSGVEEGGTRPPKNDFELTEEDWAEMAKTATIRYSIPCTSQRDWTLSPETLNQLGLKPEDAAAVREAFQRSAERVWAQVKQICMKATGVSPSTVETAGLEYCPAMIKRVDSWLNKDPDAQFRIRREIAEIRAGLRPEPGPDDPVSHFARLLLVYTGEGKAFEGDLARSFGPEEAHRLVSSGKLCMTTSSSGTLADR